MSKKTNNEETIHNINKELIRLRDEGQSRKEVSDGYHTFGELYFHRMMLFSVICNTYKDNAWKSKLHHDGTMFDGNFIVGVETKEGQYSYHYNLKYWDYFDVKVLEKAPDYDGHQPDDIHRLLDLLK